MAQITNSTKIDLQTYLSISNSGGKFETWADIVKKTRQSFFINGEILSNVLRAPISGDVIGGNVQFDWKQNKIITPFTDDLTLRNQKMTQDKAIMRVGHTDTWIMCSMETSVVDKKTCSEWAQILSEELATMFQAKQDYVNMLMIDTAMKVAIITGNVKVFADAQNMFNLTDAEWKRVGASLAQLRQKNRTLRNQNFKGYDENLETCLLDFIFANNLLLGLTSGIAGDNAYSDIKNKFAATNILGEKYYNSKMYLGRKIEQSEFYDEKAKAIKQTGINSGQNIKPFNFDKLVGLNILNPSILYFEQTPSLEQNLNVANSRTKQVIQFSFSENIAIDPKLGINNFAIFTGPVTLESYTKVDGTVVAAKDLNTKAGYDALATELFFEQPELYKYLKDIKGNPLTGAATQAQDGEVKAIWTKQENQIKYKA